MILVGKLALCPPEGFLSIIADWRRIVYIFAMTIGDERYFYDNSIEECRKPK
jgi:hypothetical protein